MEVIYHRVEQSDERVEILPADGGRLVSERQGHVGQRGSAEKSFVLDDRTELVEHLSSLKRERDEPQTALPMRVRHGVSCPKPRLGLGVATVCQCGRLCSRAITW